VNRSIQSEPAVADLSSGAADLSTGAAQAGLPRFRSLPDPTIAPHDAGRQGWRRTDLLQQHVGLDPHDAAHVVITKSAGGYRAFFEPLSRADAVHAGGPPAAPLDPDLSWHA